MELPAPARNVLSAACTALRDIDPSWAGEKWVSAESIHITLRFLGELDPLLAERISLDYARAVTAIEPFLLDLTELVAVPRPGRSSMIWARVADSTGRCQELAEVAERISRKVGLAPESRPFVPHVTLVRTRHIRPVTTATLEAAATQSGLVLAQAMSVLSATLFSSTLTPAGPVYERFAEFALGCR